MKSFTQSPKISVVLAMGMSMQNCSGPIWICSSVHAMAPSQSGTGEGCEEGLRNEGTAWVMNKWEQRVKHPHKAENRMLFLYAEREKNVGDEGTVLCAPIPGIAPSRI